MMKPMIPPVRGGVHLALFEGCGLWKPVLVATGIPEKLLLPVDGVTDALLPGEPVAHVVSAGSSSENKP